MAGTLPDHNPKLGQHTPEHVHDLRAHLDHADLNRSFAARQIDVSHADNRVIHLIHCHRA
jgi:hypothetical protein